MDICFEGIGQVVATFGTEDGKLEAGMAVTLTGNGKVGLSSEDKSLCGVTVSAARDGAVAVQIGGVVKAGYSGSTVPTVGCCALVCDGKGKVTKPASGGVSCLVLAVDREEQTVTVRL